MTKAEIARQNGKKGGRPRKHPAPPVELASAPLVSTSETQTETQPAKPETQKPTETQETEQPAEFELVSVPDDGLTSKERLFVAEYLIDGNATRAYQAVHPRCTVTTAGANGHVVLKKTEVRAAIAAAQEERRRRLQMDADEALILNTEIARVDVRQFFGPTGTRLPMAQWPDAAARAVKAIKPTRFGDTLELYDKQHAIDNVLKVSGKLTERHEVKVTHTLEDILADANARHYQRQLEQQAS